MDNLPTWLKKICNVNVGEEEMETINFPRLEYCRYISFKSTEYFGVIGVIVGAWPDRLIKLYTKGITSRLTKTKLRMREIGRGGRSWILLGLLFGPAISAFMIHGLKMSELYKTCYKLRKDEDALRRDRWAMTGGVSGLTTGFLTGCVFGIQRAGWCGLVLGSSTGCLSALVYSTVFGDSEIEDEDN